MAVYVMIMVSYLDKWTGHTECQKLRWGKEQRRKEMEMERVWVGIHMTAACDIALAGWSVKISLSEYTL